MTKRRRKCIHKEECKNEFTQNRNAKNFKERDVTQHWKIEVTFYRHNAMKELGTLVEGVGGRKSHTAYALTI